MSEVVTTAELAAHAQPPDCWIAVNCHVYNVTDFLKEHPGGADVLLEYAGKDATVAFNAVHPKAFLNLLPKSALVGTLQSRAGPSDETAGSSAAGGQREPDVSDMLNVDDFAVVARGKLEKDAWGYIAAGATDEVTLRANIAAWSRVWLRPRVMVNVGHVSTACRIQGFWSSLPVFVSATAMNGLAHPEGEVLVAKAAHKTGIIQMIPTISSRPFQDIVAARESTQVQFFQLYVSSDRERTTMLVKRAEESGCKAIFVTVDLAVPGRRESDMRTTFTSQQRVVHDRDLKGGSKGIATALFGSKKDGATFYDPQGIQCGEDAILAARYGVDGILVSNHGGRQLDGTRATIDILPEVMAALRSIDKHIEVYLDGGVRRGTDIFKALALGAKAVGIGRPVLYGLAAYGQQGVERVVEMLGEELRNCMSLMGTPSLAHISDRHVTYAPNGVCKL